MIFIPVLVISIILYLSGKRVIATLIFFFFLFDGFQLVPDEYFITKSKDFALLYVGVLFLYGCYKYEDFIPRNPLTLLIAVYLSFILILVLINRFNYGISWGEIIRTSRHYLLVLSYFVLRRLEREDISRTMKVLFCIVQVQCCLFAIQVFTGLDILTNASGNFYMGFLYRCYNVPLMLYFFVFYAIFSNPFSGKLKLITTLIPCITIFLPMHRSLSLSFILISIIGIFWITNSFRSKKKVIIACISMGLLVLFAAGQLTERTTGDLSRVAKGEFADIEEVELNVESTLLFRFAHFYERFLVTTQNRVNALFGLGLMTEDSRYTYNNFEFIIGLDSDFTKDVVQLDTSDIAWSNFIVRYGIIGTVIYLLLCGYLCLFYVRRWKNNRIAVSVVLYIILLMCTSITSDLFYHVSMLVLPLFLYDFVKDEKNNSTYITI